MKRKQEKLETNIGRVYNAYLYECKNCEYFFSVPVQIEPEFCPFCGRDDISADCEDALIISDDSIFWG